MKSYAIVLILFAGMFLYHPGNSQSLSSKANYDETKVPLFNLPDLLESFEGNRINSKRKWEKVRRGELMNFFVNNVYGKIPAYLDIDHWKIVEEGVGAVNGKARRKQIEVHFTKNGKTFKFNILLYLPNHVKKAPLFLGYNFYGNHIVYDDPAVLISDAWARNNNAYGITDHKLTEASRGVQKSNWQVEKMIDAGFGLATIFYCDVDPDKNDFSDGIHPLFYDDNQEKPMDNEWGAIAAWAWGLTKAMDYLQQDSDVDASKVVVFGHSRLGKAALWAGAIDERFAGVISNNSGCGGAALSKRKYGETVEIINTAFPHWFCDNFNHFNNNEEKLPVDQHALIALIAPRPVYIASAQDDRWADPKGEFLSGFFATPVYELYGKQGINSIEMPCVNEPIHNTVAYHIRTGKHSVTEFDWIQYIKWAGMQLYRK